MEYPYLDTLRADAITAIDAGENTILTMCRQQGQTTLLRSILESLTDRRMDVAVVSTSRDHAYEVVEGIVFPPGTELSVTVLSNHGPEKDPMDGEYEEFDLILMDNVCHMHPETLDLITARYRYFGTTLPPLEAPPPHLHNLAQNVDARWRDDNGVAIENRRPPWIPQAPQQQPLQGV